MMIVSNPMFAVIFAGSHPRLLICPNMSQIGVLVAILGILYYRCTGVDTTGQAIVRLKKQNQGNRLIHTYPFLVT